MAKDFDSQPDTTPNDKPLFVDTVESSTSSIKLVTSAVSEPIYKSLPSPKHYFMAEVRKRSPYDFIMAARDPFHYLHCELPLTFEEDQEEGKRSFSLVCEFPTIGDDALVAFIEGDEDLLGMILISFQMQILKNLFLFCAARKADKLIIQATEGQFHGLGIYGEFIQHVDKIPTKKGMDMEITIPFHAHSLKTCDEFMDNIMWKFRQTLWRDQRSNLAIRSYLKANVRLSVVA